MYDATSDPHYASIRPDILEKMNAYGQRREGIGDFLTAVMQNQAVCRADMYNRSTIYAIVLYVYNQLPAACHGSPEKVRSWLAEGIRLRDAEFVEKLGTPAQRSIMGIDAAKD